MDRIKLTRNLGRKWPHAWREHQIVEADPELAETLCERGLAVRVEEEAPQAKPKKSSPPQKATADIAPEGSGGDSKPEPSAAGKPSGSKDAGSKPKPPAKK